MQQFSKWNKGHRYLLMVIDVFSKYGWIVPLKDKKGESVTEAFKRKCPLKPSENKKGWHMMKKTNSSYFIQR